ncbi:hypothetical protein EF903_06970 [Streptomyces sp. WAC05292]|uniref:hypothetical protein n=1 Tax=Streptomyces sp. WAC05292 TaxID=2487418 RepID=UPI000F73A3E7|nr:hypothetical protein [Streptomyces sp. WAC05292]RSS94273.1 hypothetical protein EF903_06970 [Streptomyces sp. WAC05292]
MPVPRIEVVSQLPTDAAYIRTGDTQVVYVRHLPFADAVRQVHNVLPGLSLEEAEQALRDQCPELAP